MKEIQERFAAFCGSLLRKEPDPGNVMSPYNGIFIFVQTAPYMFTLASLNDGNRWRDPVYIPEGTLTTEEKFLDHLYGHDIISSRAFWNVEEFGPNSINYVRKLK